MTALYANGHRRFSALPWRSATRAAALLAVVAVATVHASPQGDDSHVHLQNVRRGKDGHGVYGMRCDTCDQTTNLPGEHMPPGNSKWSLPFPDHKMVFVGRSPSELCRQLKDPKQTGDRSLQKLLEHVSSDDLVGWAWIPARGALRLRSRVPKPWRK